MWIGRILLLGVGSSCIARWLLNPRAHRNYVARWLKALKTTSRWLPRGRNKVRRFGIQTFESTLRPNNRRTTRRRMDIKKQLGLEEQAQYISTVD